MYVYMYISVDLQVDHEYICVLVYVCEVLFIYAVCDKMKEEDVIHQPTTSFPGLLG